MAKSVVGEHWAKNSTPPCTQALNWHLIYGRQQKLPCAHTSTSKVTWNVVANWATAVGRQSTRPESTKHNSNGSSTCHSRMAGHICIESRWLGSGSCLLPTYATPVLVDFMKLSRRRSGRHIHTYRIPYLRGLATHYMAAPCVCSPHSLANVANEFQRISYRQLKFVCALHKSNGIEMMAFNIRTHTHTSTPT